jgi:molybdate transport system substrate-binding protein
VPDDLHEPIRQDAVMLTRGADNPRSRRCSTFCKGTRRGPMIRDFGYETD